QSQSQSGYYQALEGLVNQDQAFYCDCTRKQIFARDPQGLYKGYCRERKLTASDRHAVRFKSPNQLMTLTDLIQGQVELNLASALGDFVLKRRDGYFGYHLACVVDDLAQGVTHVIRGSDLLEASFAQTLVCQALTDTQLQYGHHPVAVNCAQVKYSKSAHSPAIEPKQANEQLCEALRFLNQSPPQYLKQANLNEIWHWAIINWNLSLIPPKGKIET
ncbi:MAG: tRNA glutamyl-Q(34) synthetase GluQRS, partial [Thiomicrospira sp.]|uniref:glutamate--tRNA ligase family protein n=1 Tax=Thiomicrospira sp. TaxID=935 RepID=UPI001A0750EC